MTDNIGGINVDIAVNDKDALERIAALEAALNKLEENPYNITVKFMEEGKPKAGSAKRTVDAALKLEKDAEKTLVAKIKAIEVPVMLKLAEGAVSTLKSQITEAFANFAITVKVGYEMAEPGQAVPGTGGAVRHTPGTDNIITPAAAKTTKPGELVRPWLNKFLQPDMQETIDKRVAELAKELQTAKGPRVGAIQGQLKKYEQLQGMRAAGLERQEPAAFRRWMPRDVRADLEAMRPIPPVPAGGGHVRDKMATQQRAAVETVAATQRPITSLDVVRKMAEQERLFYRWSPDIERDRQPGRTSGALFNRSRREAGVSATPVDPTLPGLGLHRQYDIGGKSTEGTADWGGSQPRKKFARRRAYLVRGRLVGEGWDGEPLLDPESIQPLGTLARPMMERARALDVEETKRRIEADPEGEHARAIARAEAIQESRDRRPSRLTEPPIPRRRTKRRRVDPYAYDPNYRHDPTLNDEEAAAAEAGERTRGRMAGLASDMAGQAAGGPNKFGPRNPEERRDYERAGAARLGREVARVTAFFNEDRVNSPGLGRYPGAAIPDPTQRGNPVSRTADWDPRGIYPRHEGLFALSRAYLHQQQHGTSKFPLVREVGTKLAEPVPDDMRDFLVGRGLARNAQSIGNVREFEYQGKKFEIKKPRDLVKEAGAQLMQSEEISDSDRKKFTDIIEGRAGTMVGAPGGMRRYEPMESSATPGFVMQSEGFGPAARSQRDMPGISGQPGMRPMRLPYGRRGLGLQRFPGNILNQERVEKLRLRDIWKQMDRIERAQVLGRLDRPQLGEADISSAEEMIAAFSPEGRSITKERQLRADVPKLMGEGKQLYFPQHEEILNRYMSDQQGKTQVGTEDIEDRFIRRDPTTHKPLPTTAYTTALGRMAQAQAQFLKDQQLKAPNDPWKESARGLLQVIGRGRKSTMRDKYRRTDVSGMGLFHSESAIEEAAKVITGTERSNVEKPNRTPLAPVANELQQIQDRLTTLLGNSPEVTGRTPISPAYNPETGETAPGLGNYVTTINRGKPATKASGQTLTPKEVASLLRARSGHYSSLKRSTIIEPVFTGAIQAAEAGGDKQSALNMAWEAGQLFQRRSELRAQLPAEEEAERARGITHTPVIPREPRILGDEGVNAIRERAGVRPLTPDEMVAGPEYGPILNARMVGTYMRARAGDRNAKGQFLLPGKSMVDRNLAVERYLASGQPLTLEKGEGASIAAPLEEPIDLASRRIAAEAEGTARLAASDVAPPLGPPAATGALSTGGGPIHVIVDNFNDLVTALTSKAIKAITSGARAAESSEPPMTDSQRKKQGQLYREREFRASQERDIFRNLQGFEVDEPILDKSGNPILGKKGTPLTKKVRPFEHIEPSSPIDRGFEGKSDAQIEAETDILEARSLSPTRAFTTAVGAAFAKTLGGGGDFERRLRQFQRARARQGKAEETVGEVQGEVVAPYLKARELRAQRRQLEAAGQPVPGALKAAEQSQFDRAEEARGRLTEARGVARERGTEAGAARRGLVSTTGVLRGFGALGLGAIGGGIIFRAGSEIVNKGVELLADAANKAADALSGFAITADRVNREIATALPNIKGTMDQRAAAIFGGTGVSQQVLGELTGQGLLSRGGALAGAQQQRQINDLFRTTRFNQGSMQGGYDRALFGQTGGLANTGLFGDPGFLQELVSGLTPDLGSAMARRSQQFGPLGFAAAPAAAMADVLAGQLPTDELKRYADQLNSQLDRTTASFEVVTNATEEQTKAMIESASKISAPAEIGARMLAQRGLTFTGPGGRALQGTEFGAAIQGTALGSTIPDAEGKFLQDQKGLTATFRDVSRRAEHTRAFTLPVQNAFQNLISPFHTPGLATQAAGEQGLLGKEDQDALNASTQQTLGLQESLNKSYEAGKAKIQQMLPPDLFNVLVSTGQEIVNIQDRIAKQSFGLQAQQYANQLIIAKRTLSDIAGLSGGISGIESSQLGILQRQNVMLERRSAQIGFEMQQRSINLDLALAGFEAPGETSEQRGAIQESAKQRAKFEQEQLNISKQQFGIGVKVFDIQNLRAFQDISRDISQLEGSIKLMYDSQDANEQIDVLQRRLNETAATAGTYISEVEQAAGIAMSEIAQLEADYGTAIGKISVSTIAQFAKDIKEMYGMIDDYSGGNTLGGSEQDKRESNVIAGVTGGGGGGPLPTGPGGLPMGPFYEGQKVPKNGYPHEPLTAGEYQLEMKSGIDQNGNGLLGMAKGGVFNTGGKQSLIVGEAGTETVAILRNPRPFINPNGGFGGSGATIINITGNYIRDEGDIAKIARQVEEVLNRRTQLQGLR